jgi:acyl transferase domain-containing protein
VKNTPVSTAPIAIVGMACLFPKAPSLGAYWQNLRDGTDAIAEVPASHWSAESYFSTDTKAPDRTYAKRGGFLDPIAFRPREWGIAPRDLEATDTTQLLGMVVARRAMEDAGYGESGKAFDRERASVALGVTSTLELVIPLGARLGHPIWRQALDAAGVTGPQADAVVDCIAASYVPWQENSFPGLLGNVAAGRIANRLDLQGSNCVVDAACASSLGALHLAVMELESGRADMVVAGGFDTFNDIFMYMCFSKTPALSPTGDARPFSAQGDGTILGEGLGALVLKPLAAAQRDNDKIYAVIRGIGRSSDGKGQAIYAPSAAGQARCLRDAYARADVSPRTVELVEGHGTGTKVGDSIEIQALSEVYGAASDDHEWCTIGSVKSAIGHTKAAAGLAGVMKAALALHHRVLPPTLKIGEPLPALRATRTPFRVFDRARPWIAADTHPRRAGVSAFGFGGSNFHCVLEEYGASQPAIDWHGAPQLVALSGTSAGDLESGLRRLAEEKIASVRHLVIEEMRGRFSPRDPFRVVGILHRGTNEVESASLNRWAQALARGAASSAQGDVSALLPNELYFATGSVERESRKLCVLFPGQGAQAPHMLQDLLCRFPHAARAFELFAAGGKFGDIDLIDAIFPPIGRGEDGAANLKLRRTDLAQASLGAIELALWDILANFGLKPQLAIGHSYGELVALCVSGKLAREDFAAMTRIRGQAMAHSDGDGAMLAILAAREDVEAWLQQQNLALVVANHNAPNQVVLAGKKSIIEQATLAAQEKGWSCTALNVGGAFHSPHMRLAAERFASAVAHVDFHPADFQVIANFDGEVYSNEVLATRKTLARQLISPVEFVAGIRRAGDQGAQTFLELGPGRRLCGLVRQILGSAVQTLSVDEAPAMEGLARVLAQLACGGHAVNLSAWRENFTDDRPDDGSDTTRGPVVWLNGSNIKDSPKKALPAALERARAIANQAAKVAPSALTVSENRPRTPTMPRETNTTPRNDAMTAPFAEELAKTEASLQAILSMAEQAAKVHQSFLASQEQVLLGYQSLLARQQELLAASQGLSLASIRDSRPLIEMQAPRAESVRSSAIAVPHQESAPAAKPVAKVSPKPQVQSGSSSAVVSTLPAPNRAQPRSDLARVVLEIVADKTGFPLEMLDPALHVDTDLGIDSIKRVEILAAISERVGLTNLVRADELSSLTRLSDWIDRLAAQPVASQVDSPSSEKQAAEASVPASPIADVITRSVMSIIADKTGFPPEMLTAELSLESDLGIDSIKRVEIFAALQEKHPELGPLPASALAHLVRIDDLVAEMTKQPAVALAAPAVKNTEVAQAPDDDDPIAQVLLNIVADKTGFPLEMLNLELDLESDLGIDSIKRVEILAALREKEPTLREMGAHELANARRLADWIAALGASAGPRVGSAVQRSGPAIERPVAKLDSRQAPSFDAPVTSFDVETPSAFLSQQWQLTPVFAGPVQRHEATLLPTLARGAAIVVAGAVEDSLAAGLAAVLRRAGFNVHLADIAAPWRAGPAQALFLVAPPWALDADFVRDAMMRVVDFGPSRFGPPTDGKGLLVAVTLLDGQFGYSQHLDPSIDVRQAGLWGLVKTAGREWPHLRHRVFDVDASWDNVTDIVAGILAECESAAIDNHPVECGLDERGRWHLDYREIDRENATMERDQVLEVGADDVVVVTGGGRGITAHVAARFAQSGASIALLGRTPWCDEAQLLRECSSEAEIKRAILSQCDEKMAPRELESRYRLLMAQRELAENLRGLAKLGAADVRYYCVDVRDAEAVGQTIAQIQAEQGPITIAVHGAGALADRRLEDKTAADFEQVWAPKVDGAAALLAALNDAPLRGVLLFSSSTARFGRVGQADYAAANCVLEALAASLSARRPHTKIVAIGWGPWAGGMVTPALERIFASEKIGLIPLADGARLAFDTLIRTAKHRTTLVLGPGSELPVDRSKLRVRDAAPAAVEATQELPIVDSSSAVLTLVEQGRAGTEVEVENTRASAVSDQGGATSGIEAQPVEQPVEQPESPTKTARAGAQEASTMRVLLKRQVDLANEPNLRAHVLGGRAVLPAALMAEWLASAVAHANPGLHVVGIDAFQVYRALHVHGSESLESRIRVGRIDRTKNLLRANAELETGTDSLTKRVLHSKASVILGHEPFSHLDSPDRVPALRDGEGWSMGRSELYPAMLFHGRDYQILERVIGHDSQHELLEAELRRTPSPSEWSPHPIRAQWYLDPLALDAAFQLAIVWCQRNLKLASLPTGFGALRQTGLPWPQDGLRLRMRMRRRALHRVVADFEWLNRQGALVAVLRDYACVTDESLRHAFAARELEVGTRP